MLKVSRGFTSQRGFTFTNILFFVGTVALIVGGIKWYLKQQQRVKLRQTVEMQGARLRDQLQGLLKADPSWRNAMLAVENVNLTCLREHRSCHGKGGLLAVRDANNRNIYNSAMKTNGFSLDGKNCANFNEQIGDDTCPMRMEILWAPKCGGDCVDPQTVEVRGVFKYRPRSEENKLPGLQEALYNFSFSRSAVPGDPRTCYDLLQSGKTMDGTYTIKPDPLLGTFAVYCDQTRDGGGWALVVNSARIEAFSTPLDNSLTTSSNGRLANNKIAAYLTASTEFQFHNNIRLVLPEIDRGIVLSMSTMGSTDAEAIYSAPTSGGDCKTVSQTATRAQKTPSTAFGVSFSGHGEAAFTDKLDASGNDAPGFQVCFGANSSGKNCGTGCSRAWTGYLTRQKGSLWIR